MRLFRRRKRLNLALQGGGVHGAFTWGVLDRLLGEDDIVFGWLSGTSAGAVNAVCLAHGLAHRDNQLAKDALTGVWTAVERAGVSDLMRLNPFLAGLAKAAPIANMSAFFSPYDFNPVGFDPLRKILAEHVDFDAIRRNRQVGLLLAATDVATGRARLFRRDEISVDVVLASACLPSLHHAVEIDGRAYWDGGFSANPDLLTLAAESPIGDTLLVKLNPLYKAGVPRSAKTIEDRVNTITFNQPLLRDIETILLAQDMAAGWFMRRSGRLAHLKAHRFHIIAAGRHTSGLGADSKVMPEMELLAYLRAAGEREAANWIEQHKSSIGRRSTVDLRERFNTPEPSEFDAHDIPEHRDQTPGDVPERTSAQVR